MAQVLKRLEPAVVGRQLSERQVVFILERLKPSTPAQTVHYSMPLLSLCFMCILFVVFAGTNFKTDPADMLKVRADIQRTRADMQKSTHTEKKKQRSETNAHRDRKMRADRAKWKREVAMNSSSGGLNQKQLGEFGSKH